MAASSRIDRGYHNLSKTISNQQIFWLNFAWNCPAANFSPGTGNVPLKGRPSHAKAPGNNSKLQSRYNPSNYSISRSEGASQYAIYSAKVSGSKINATVFCDSGSEISFISDDAVHKFRPRKVGYTPIKLTTLASSIDIISNIYELNFFQRMAWHIM